MTIFCKLSSLALIAGMGIVPASADTWDLGTDAGFALFSTGAVTITSTSFSTNGGVAGNPVTGFAGGVTPTGGQIGIFETAFGQAEGDPATFNGPALASTLTPGVYQINNSVTLGPTLTFNGAGDYVIRVNGSLTDSVPTVFTLENGATAADILFLVNGVELSAAGAVIDGTIFTSGAVTLSAPGTVTDGIFANAAITISGAGLETVDSPGSSSVSTSTVPEPSSVALLFGCVIMTVAALSRRIRTKA